MARNDEGEAEIFRSIQGEGPRAGQVRAFVRMSGCNLHCRWCDTAYTWNWNDADFPHEDARRYERERESLAVAADDVVARVLDFDAPGVVITGGEPLMQGLGVMTLAQKLKTAAPHLLIEIETNGTRPPNQILAGLVDLFVVSPKLAHSGNDAELALKRPSLEIFASYPQSVFKFVCRTVQDIKSVAEIAHDVGVAPARIWIMAEGRDSETLRERKRVLIAPALAHGFNFSDRLHVHLFGARRGV